MASNGNWEEEVRSLECGCVHWSWIVCGARGKHKCDLGHKSTYNCAEGKQYCADFASLKKQRQEIDNQMRDILKYEFEAIDKQGRGS